MGDENTPRKSKRLVALAALAQLATAPSPAASPSPRPYSKVEAKSPEELVVENAQLDREWVADRALSSRPSTQGKVNTSFTSKPRSRVVEALQKLPTGYQIGR